MMCWPGLRTSGAVEVTDDKEYPVFELRDLQLIRLALRELGTREALALDEQIGGLVGFFVVDMSKYDGEDQD